MELDPMMQTLLIAILVGMVPKLVDTIFNQAQNIPWQRLVPLKPRQHTVTVEYEKCATEKEIFVTKGDHHTQITIYCLSVFVSNYCNKNFTTGGCHTWTATSSKDIVPTSSVQIDDVYVRFQNKSDSADGKITSSTSVTMIAPTLEQVHRLIETAEEYNRKQNLHIPPQYIAQNIRDGKRFWTQTPLHIDTSWDDLFYPEKDMVRQAIENLDPKQKISLLLHGPPGTGKTSTIRAIAVATQRNLVNIDLSLVHNNQELHQIVFNTRELPRMQGRHDSIVLADESKFIFVFEEIDKQLEDIKERDVLLEQTLSHTNNQEANTSVFEAYAQNISRVKENRLTIGGLQTLLDGLLQMHDCIVIMTTNHREKLPAALLRPGRVTHDIYLGPLEARYCREMIEKIHQKSPEHILEKHWIPADLEQLLAQYPLYDDFSREFEKKNSKS